MPSRSGHWNCSTPSRCRQNTAPRSLSYFPSQQRFRCFSLRNFRLNHVLISRGTTPLTENGASLYDLLRRPSVRLSDLLPRDGIPEDVRSEAEIEAKYAGYLAQQEREIARLKRLEKLIIPVELDYNLLSNLSIEGRDRLTRVRPSTFGQAARIPGISHADLSMLAITLRR